MSVPSFDVSVAAHYVPRRIPYLADVLFAIAEWDRPDVSVTIVTNDLAIADEPLMTEARERLERRGFSMVFDKTEGLAHPWHLTWWHKQHLHRWFERQGTAEDLFMYIEDDIVVDRENLAYFTKFLPVTKKIGCLPGFLRYENGSDGRIMSPDYRGFQEVSPQQRRKLNGQDFIAPTHSYWAGFILDRELCAEYFASPWSDLEKADRMPQSRRHSCRVQSAWALTFENVPDGLPSRYIVPVDEAMTPLKCCLVWHSANNYTVSKQHNFGTVRMDEIFLKPGLRARTKQMLWDVQAFLRRASDKVRRLAG